MNDGTKYYIVEASSLPEVFHKVCEAKSLMEKGKAKTVADAVSMVGISRSAFYKYKDSVRPFYEMGVRKIITFHIMLEDRPGVLSGMLKIFAENGANILTINQTIPINGQAALTVSAETMNMKTGLDKFMDIAQGLDGIVRIELLARE
ncbi:MAG: ACT domain-containing protein [Clostridia bacterium]|nr:ACT domain-containing protein [Clostridia bacterium]